MDFYEAKALDVLSSQGGNSEDGGSVFESRRGQSSNINQNNLVAPRGHDTFCTQEYRGIIRAA